MEDKEFFRNKVVWINGIMSIFIVFLHSHNIERYSNLKWSGSALIESFLSRGIGNLGVPLFFFMSAILFFQNYSWDKVLSKYKSRIKSILIPYLAWNSLYYLFFIVLISFPLSRAFMDTKQIAIDGPTIFNAVFLYEYNGVYWFMYHLIFFVLLSPVIYGIIKWKYGILLPIGCIIINYRIPTFAIFGNVLRIDMFIFWLLGAYLAVHHRDRLYIRSNKTTGYLSLTVAIIAIVIRYFFEYLSPNIKLSGYWMNILLIVDVLAVWFAFDLIRVKHTYEWMNMSFFIYSLHPIIVDTIKKGWSALLPDNDVMALMNYFGTTALSILLCYALARFLIRFMPMVYDALSGGRMERMQKQKA